MTKTKMRHEDVPVQNAEDNAFALAAIREILWLDKNGEWNQDKEWSPDTLDEIVAVLNRYDLAPDDGKAAHDLAQRNQVEA